MTGEPLTPPSLSDRDRPEEACWFYLVEQHQIAAPLDGRRSEHFGEAVKGPPQAPGSLVHSSDAS